MIIICDSSPIIALSILDSLHLLDHLFKEVIVPRSVFNELTVKRKPEADKITVWAKDKLAESTDEQLVQTFSLLLDKGEAEAMSLYWEKKADFLLIDEKKGRRIAAYNHIKIIGTLGILLLSKEKGLIPAIKPLLDILQHSYIRISDDLYQQALKLAKE